MMIAQRIARSATPPPDFILPFASDFLTIATNQEGNAITALRDEIGLSRNSDRIFFSVPVFYWQVEETNTN